MIATPKKMNVISKSLRIGKQKFKHRVQILVPFHVNSWVKQRRYRINNRAGRNQFPENESVLPIILVHIHSLKKRSVECYTGMLSQFRWLMAKSGQFKKRRKRKKKRNKTITTKGDP